MTWIVTPETQKRSVAMSERTAGPVLPDCGGTASEQADRQLDKARRQFKESLPQRREDIGVCKDDKAAASPSACQWKLATAMVATADRVSPPYHSQKVSAVAAVLASQGVVDPAEAERARSYDQDDYTQRLNHLRAKIERLKADRDRDQRRSLQKSLTIDEDMEAIDTLKNDLGLAYAKVKRLEAENKRMHDLCFQLGYDPAQQAIGMEQAAKIELLSIHPNRSPDWCQGYAAAEFDFRAAIRAKIKEVRGE